MTELLLTETNIKKLLWTFLEQSNKAGAFDLAESDIIYKSKKFLDGHESDPRLDTKLAWTIFIQGLNKGQLHGDYTFEESDVIIQCCKKIQQDHQIETTPKPEKSNEPVPYRI